MRSASSWSTMPGNSSPCSGAEAITRRPAPAAAGTPSAPVASQANRRLSRAGWVSWADLPWRGRRYFGQAGGRRGREDLMPRGGLGDRSMLEWIDLH
ncbi:hypothetical protein ABZS96_41790 [Streptomyces avermitilis]|uniref:hypothetical protein n=1 Tax=Streptomyces avermitilis TaxID=33903 RepID=UPI0033ADCD6E